ncbi:MAG: MurR/RpiR family transcriptional regulator [Erysipelotrichaceae bacterium]|nr:MurR/RpiR family transcriptional regulator [Erysipelotrichaceae bacterium]
MIIEQLIDGSSLTHTEQSIANYILDAKNDISQLTSYELAKNSYTSQTAVIRLYKKFGLKNFREFISLLVIERNEYLKHNMSSTDMPSQYFTSLKDIQNTISVLYSEGIFRTNLTLDANVVTRLCNRIFSSRIIDIYGFGITESLSNTLAFKLQSLGFYVQCHSGINRHYLDTIDQHNVTILISQTGSNPNVEELAQIMKHKKNYTVGLLGHKNDDIIDNLDDYLLFEARSFTDIDSMYGTLTGNYLIDVIYAHLIYRKQISDLALTKE